MNQRIHNLDKWVELAEGSAMRFEGKERTVILEVNCPRETEFYVSESDDVGEVTESFLAVAKGRDRIEFAVKGDFDLTSDVPCHVYSFDGQLIAHHELAPVIFTRLANRRERNANLEMIEYKMRLNQQRFLAELELEQETRLVAMEQGLAKYLPNRSEVAPPELVGKAPGDSVAEPAVAEVVADVEPAAAAAGKRRKADQPA